MKERKRNTKMQKGISVLLLSAALAMSLAPAGVLASANEAAEEIVSNNCENSAGGDILEENAGAVVHTHEWYYELCLGEIYAGTG